MKELENWPGYAVTEDGQVWSRHLPGQGCRIGTTWKILKPQSGGKRRTPYQTVRLSKHGQPFTVYIHRLVLEAFVGPCPDGMEGCHEDDNPVNNHLSNLKWATPKKNKEDARRNKRIANGERCGLSKLKEEDVITIRWLYQKGLHLSLSQTEIAKRFNVDHKSVSAIVNRKTWKHI